MPLFQLDEMRSIALDALSEQGEKWQGSNPSEALHEEAGTVAYDDVSGEPLDLSRVRAARVEEIAYFKSMNVYEKVPVSEAWERTGKGPIQTRWIDINKGDEGNPLYRSRLVAKEFNTEKRPDLFAATPPAECLKMLLSKMAEQGQN